MHSVIGGGKEHYIRLSQTLGADWQDMRGVCAVHGNDCSLSRSCRSKRPVGQVWAWLEYGAIPGITKQHHKTYRPDKATRHAARRRFASAYPDAGQWFEAEADPNPGSESEPSHID